MNLIFIYYYVSAAVAQCQCVMILPQSHGFDTALNIRDGNVIFFGVYKCTYMA